MQRSVMFLREKMIESAKQKIVFIDCGAFLGEYYTLRFFVPGLEYHGIEAHPVNFYRLKTLLSHFHWPYEVNHVIGTRTQVYNLAIHNECGTALLKSPHKLTNLSTIGDNPRRFGQNSPVDTFNIESITIDEFVEKFDIEHVDFIKLDIEGAEYRALLGATDTIERWHPSFVCEMNKQNMKAFCDDPPRIMDFMNDAGYKNKNIGSGDMYFWYDLG